VIKLHNNILKKRTLEKPKTEIKYKAERPKDKNLRAGKTLMVQTTRI
jgi:hypothetical protein